MRHTGSSKLNEIRGHAAGLRTRATYGSGSGGSGTFHGVSGSGDVMQHRVLRGLQAELLAPF